MKMKKIYKEIIITLIWDIMPVFLLWWFMMVILYNQLLGLGSKLNIEIPTWQFANIIIPFLSLKLTLEIAYKLWIRERMIELRKYGATSPNYRKTKGSQSITKR